MRACHVHVYIIILLLISNNSLSVPLAFSLFLSPILLIVELLQIYCNPLILWPLGQFINADILKDTYLDENIALHCTTLYTNICNLVKTTGFGATIYKCDLK